MKDKGKLYEMEGEITEKGGKEDMEVGTRRVLAKEVWRNRECQQKT